MQEFFSLKMSYDVLLCFTSMSYHRHAENVLSKVDIACGQFVLYLWRDGTPEKCQWTPLYSVALSPHVLSLANISLWRLRKFTKPQSHLQQIPISFQKGTPWECGFSLHSATTDTAHLCNHCICDDSLTALQPLTISAWFFCNG